MKTSSNTQTINKISYDNIKEMAIVRDFEKHKYNLPEHGAGIIDTVANFVSQNKDTSSNITQAIKAAKRLMS